jgi:hypothetical protein
MTDGNEMGRMHSDGQAAAPTTGANTTHTTGPTEFQAQDTGAPEQHNGTVLLVEAYAVLWCILMGWIVLLWRKQNTLNTRLSDLERAIDHAAAAAEKHAAGTDR